MEQWMDVSFHFFHLVSVPAWVPWGLMYLGVVSLVAVALIALFYPHYGDDKRTIKELVATFVGVVIFLVGLASVLGIGVGSVDASESVRRHLEESYQVEVVHVDQALSESDVRGGVAVDVPGDDVVKFVSDGTTEGDRFVDAQGKEVDIEVYRVLDTEVLASEVAEVTGMGEPVVSFAQAEMSGKMASENSDAVLVSGVVDGVRVQASVLVDDHGQVRDVRVEGKSLLK